MQSETSRGVDAVSANHVWAADWEERGALSRTLAMHWDGVEWARMPTQSREEGRLIRSMDRCRTD